MEPSSPNPESPSKAFTILQLCSSLSEKAGGVQQTLIGLSKNLPSNGTGVEFWGFKETRQNPGVDRLVGQVRLFKRIPLPFFAVSPALSKAIRRSDAELLHLHGLWEFPSFATRYWPDPKPLIVSPHGMLDSWALQNSGWKKKIALGLYERKNLKRCSCFHALNHSEYESIRSLGFRQPVAVIPNGVELPAPLSDRERTSSGISTLFYLGRIHRKKNLLSLMRSWKAVPADLKKNWRLRLAGWGDDAYGRELSALLEERMGLEGPLYGETKEAAFRGASAFILPSLSEGLPMAVLEAWSNGLPVLMSRECHLPEGFEAGAALETGTDEKSIKESLVKFLQMSDEQRREMGRKGRGLVEERFTWPGVASKMSSVYSWLLGQGPQPDCVKV